MGMEMNVCVDKPINIELPFKVFDEEVLFQNTKDNVQEQEKEEDLPFGHFNDEGSKEHLMEGGSNNASPNSSVRGLKSAVRASWLLYSSGWICKDKTRSNLRQRLATSKQSSQKGCGASCKVVYY